MPTVPELDSQMHQDVAWADRRRRRDRQGMARYLELAADLPAIAYFAIRHPDRSLILDEFVRLSMEHPDWKRLAAQALNKSEATFRYQGREYSYFYHPYHYTWASERTVEIPLAREFLRALSGSQVLEVGNVLNHYSASSHRVVVDKYEKGEGVLNTDIIDYQPQVQFDAVIAISTLEHIGRDERPQDRTKARRALNRLDSFLRPGGHGFVTVPLGHNPDLDELMLGERPFGGTVGFLERVSWDNRWRECPASVARTRPEGDWQSWRDHGGSPPFPFANAIAVAEWTKIE